MRTPPRIRGLVDKLEKAVRMEYWDKNNKTRRQSETTLAKVELLRAFAIVSGGKDAKPDS